MKIHFTKKEYRQLLELIYLGDWLASAHSETDESPYEAIREKIYSYAKAFHCEDWIEYDKSLGRHYETAAFEGQGVMERIEQYNRGILNEQAD